MKIVFTFDDALKSHISRAVPLLLNYGFGGTFFITNNRDLWNRHHTHPSMIEEGMTDADVIKMFELGFEIGNHTFDHENSFNGIVEMEKYLEFLGVDKPVSYCYPSYRHAFKIEKFLRNRGYNFARIGYSRGIDHDNCKPKNRVPVYYRKSKSNKLAIESTMIFNHHYHLDDFKREVDSCPEGCVCIFTAHGLLCEELWSRFKDIVKYAEGIGAKGIPMREL